MLFELFVLLYVKDVLVLYIFVEIIEYYYGKYYQIYVINLNNLIKGIVFEGKLLEEIICSFEGGVFNNVVQVWNYIFYWNCLVLNVGGELIGKVVEVIVVFFGSFVDFKVQFIDVVIKNFGFGWIWLVKNSDGKLVIVLIFNVGILLIIDVILLLIVDVWEYVYYIDYCNVCFGYLEYFWVLVNWEFVVKNFVV